MRRAKYINDAWEGKMDGWKLLDAMSCSVLLSVNFEMGWGQRDAKRTPDRSLIQIDS